MPSVTLSSVIALGALAGSVLAQGPPLASLRFDWNNLPYQADTGTGERGTQFGYNICNSTTEGPESRCQTATINSIEDFCLWGPPEPNSLVGDTEGEAVAWCTQPGRGTRIIPRGALTGVQFMRTRAYIQVTGHINQELINMAPTDDGGEMDPHGADQRGNPLGGLLFTNAFPSSGGDRNNFQQVIEWHNFMGANVFCLKACDPSVEDDDRFCEHIFDRIGCTYNAPAAYRDGVFESCEGEVQDFPGIYTNAAGETVTYTQPPESLGPITTIPYTARIPASSNCVTYTSSVIYASAPAPSGATSSSAAPTSSARPTGSAATSARSSAASAASATASASTNAAVNLGPASWTLAGIAAFVVAAL